MKQCNVVARVLHRPRRRSRGNNQRSTREGHFSAEHDESAACALAAYTPLDLVSYAF